MAKYFRLLKPKYGRIQEAEWRQFSFRRKNLCVQQTSSTLWQFVVDEAFERPRPKPKRPNEGYTRGTEAEERVFAVFKAFRDASKFPTWLQRLARGNQLADALGIDAIAITENGHVPIQIKTSSLAKEKHLATPERVHIPCVVVTPALSDDDIFLVILREVEFVWEMRERARAAAR